MTIPMTPELYWLVATLTMTALFWMPYIVDRILEHGPWPALSNPQPDVPPKALWAARLMRSHVNAVENLVIFAPLVLAIHVTGMHTAATASASMIYFFARLAHVVIYTAGIPLLRTIAFLVGFACQMILAMTLLGII